MSGFFESRLSVSDKRFIAGRVDKDTWTVLRIALQFGEHVKVSAMSTQKDVARQSAQLRKRVLEILDDVGVANGMAGCGDEVVFGPKTDASDDDDIPHCCGFLPWKVRA